METTCKKNSHFVLLFRGVKSAEDITFFDWETQTVIRRIEASPKNVYWNEIGNMVALALEDSMYILKCNKTVKDYIY